MLRLLTIVKPNTVRLQGIDRPSKVLLRQVKRVFQFECLESVEEFLFGRFHKGRTKDKVARKPGLNDVGLSTSAAMRRAQI
jgi:hypothetical protein